MVILLGFPEKYLAEANGEGYSGEGVDVLGGVRGEEDEIGVHPCGDATGARRVAEARRKNLKDRLSMCLFLCRRVAMWRWNQPTGIWREMVAIGSFKGGVPLVEPAPVQFILI
jgi:hypothetical protein